MAERAFKGELQALGRQGLKDLQSVILNPFPPGHIAQHEEPGTIANPTQSEVHQQNYPEQSAGGVHGPKAKASTDKGQAAPEVGGSQQPESMKRDPLDRAREQARETGRERGRDRSPEM